MKKTLTGKVGKTSLIVIVLFLLTNTVLAGGGGLYISRYVIGGGGGHSVAGHYTMNATVGQAVAGTFNTISYKLCAGFWCGVGEYKVYLPVIIRN